MERLSRTITGAAAIPLVLTGCESQSPHPSASLGAAGCESPASFSPEYKGDPQALPDHSNWKWVRMGMQDIPEGASVTVGYGSPATVEKLPHPSELILPEEGVHEKGVLVSIGKGAVQYWVTITYNNASLENSLLCDRPPTVYYPPEPQVEKPDTGIEPRGW